MHLPFIKVSGELQEVQLVEFNEHVLQLESQIKH